MPHSKQIRILGHVSIFCLICSIFGANYHMMKAMVNIKLSHLRGIIESLDGQMG